MNKDDSLLKLEKKLETYSEKEITLSKFNMIKPVMKMDSQLNKKGLEDFLQEFKRKTDKVLQNPEKYNIENEMNNNDETTAINPNRIELDLALGVLEEKQPKDIQPSDIINNATQDEETLEIDEGTKELLNFISNKGDNNEDDI